MATSPFFRDLILARTLMDESVMAGRPWASLHLDDPGESGANEMPQDESYQRKQISIVRIAAGTLTNAEILEFPDLPEARINYFGFWMDRDAGPFILGGPIVGFRVLKGQAARWREGELVVRIG